MTQSKIDPELLISLIENRPPIWDRSREDYKDKTKRTTAWAEICIIMKEDFEEMEEKDRRNYAKMVIKKWNQIRDSWTRSLNAINRSKKSGSASKYVKKYCYHNQLLFLKKVIKPAETEDCAPDETQDLALAETQKDDDAPSETNDSASVGVKLEISFNQDKEIERELSVGNKRQTQQNPVNFARKIKKRDESNQELNPMDHNMMSFMDYHMKTGSNSQNEDRNLCFFKSLLPSLASLNDDQTLQFQAGVISLLQDIKARNRK